MDQTIQFETPENVLVTYRVAGPGTRYIAFIIDALIIVLGFLLVGLVVGALLIALAASGQLAADISGMIAALIFFVAFGFAFIGYFALFEMFMHGQTPGKRMLRIRVVNEHGFSLGAGAVLLRSIFRIIDAVPILWIVPLLSPKVQRFGDMVSGTIVVLEDTPHLSAIREHLAMRDPTDREFQFNPQHLSALRPSDVEAMELFLERRELLHPEHRSGVSLKIARGVAHRLGMDPPSDALRERFIEDLLAGYARREAREMA